MFVLVRKMASGLTPITPILLSPFTTLHELCIFNKRKMILELWKGLNFALLRTILATFQKPGGHGSYANHVHIFA